jgi:uncharacterized membrane protein
MALAGRLHPLLIHFPISLVLVAATAEAVALITGTARWRFLAWINVRGASLFGIAAALAGWRLAATLGPPGSPLLEWHRWAGTAAAGLATIAALTTLRSRKASATRTFIYRIALFGAAALMAVTGHLGGVLVWGADFLRP